MPLIERSHAMTIGANMKPTLCVPWCWSEKRTTNITHEIATTYSEKIFDGMKMLVHNTSADLAFKMEVRVALNELTLMKIRHFYLDTGHCRKNWEEQKQNLCQSLHVWDPSKVFFFFFKKEIYFYICMHKCTYLGQRTKSLKDVRWLTWNGCAVCIRD